MKIRSLTIETEGFILGGAEHATESPPWFHRECSNGNIMLSRAADGRIQAMIGNAVAKEGDWIVLTPGGIKIVKPTDFHNHYKEAA